MIEVILLLLSLKSSSVAQIVKRINLNHNDVVIVEGNCATLKNLEFETETLGQIAEGSFEGFQSGDQYFISGRTQIGCPSSQTSEFISESLTYLDSNNSARLTEGQKKGSRLIAFQPTAFFDVILASPESFRIIGNYLRFFSSLFVTQAEVIVQPDPHLIHSPIRLIAWDSSSGRRFFNTSHFLSGVLPQADSQISEVNFEQGTFHLQIFNLRNFRVCFN